MASNGSSCAPAPSETATTASAATRRDPNACAQCANHLSDRGYKQGRDNGVQSHKYGKACRRALGCEWGGAGADAFVLFFASSWRLPGARRARLTEETHRMLALTTAATASPRLIGGWRQAEVAAGRPSIVNCTWQNFTQKIDHFGDALGTFPQRLCLYDKWWRPVGGAGGQFRAAADAPGPILFYTGNESPVDEYVNNTGLMWEIGERLGGLLLFAPTLLLT